MAADLGGGVPPRPRAWPLIFTFTLMLPFPFVVELEPRPSLANHPRPRSTRRLPPPPMPMRVRLPPREERDDGGGGGGAKVFRPGRSMDLRFGRSVGLLGSLGGVVTGVPAAGLELVCGRGGRGGFPFVAGAVGLDPPFAGEVRVGVEGGIGAAAGEAGRSLRATLLWRGVTGDMGWVGALAALPIARGYCFFDK
ncbi:hypothetical protein DFH08DRAFT_840372 [Mycena albidolilacea]|uniref:Uncharacterized protein n=1 Tax=Mycena albidolilacea TaxID=1033008 RepID=A0AAD7F4U8_9AGAR|nr:hypothetical protein DFH08DRAFT_840372 [Mycena albidolilacea]